MSAAFDKAQRIYSECVQTGNYEPSFDTLSALILKGDDVCRGLQLRSHLHYLAGNAGLAKSDLNEAISLAPSSAGLFYDRGSLHHHNNDYYLALRDFSDAVNLAHAVGDDDLIDAVEHHIIDILEKMRSS